MPTLLESISPTSRELLKANDSRTHAVLLRVACHAYRLFALDDGPKHDAHLCEMQGGLGELAAAIRTNRAGGERLLRIAAYGLGWLEAFKNADEDMLALVLNERERQRQLFRARVHSFQVESPIVDPLRKLRILVEEVGEVADAIDKLESRSSVPFDLRRDHLRDELVQVVAVAVAWLESLEGGVR